MFNFLELIEEVEKSFSIDNIILYNKELSAEEQIAYYKGVKDCINTIKLRLDED